MSPGLHGLRVLGFREGLGFRVSGLGFRAFSEGWPTRFTGNRCAFCYEWSLAENPQSSASCSQDTAAGKARQAAFRNRHAKGSMPSFSGFLRNTVSAS